MDEAPAREGLTDPRPDAGQGKSAVRLRLEAVVITTAALIVLTTAAGLWTVATGAYDVSATAEHWPITEWALNTLQQRSVAARAGELPVPIPDDTAAVEHGFQHFHAMCVECHGAPGFDRGESGQGLNPIPPRLETEAHEWTDAELFRIIKHGIRLAGMPAFGPTHTDEEIAEIVAFIRAMETMTEEEYVERVRGHGHEPGTPEHEH